MAEKLTVGFVLDDSLDRPDGVQQYVLTLGNWLTEQGHQVHYLAGQTERQDITNVHSLSRNISTSFNHNRMSVPLPADVETIRKLLTDVQFDVLHIQMPYSPMLAARVIKMADSETAVLGTFHITPYSRIEGWATRALGLWLHDSLRRFDQVFSVSPAAQLFATKSFGLPSTVLPGVVDVRRFKDAKSLDRLDDKKHNVVFLGRLVGRKGCQHLLKAIDQLNQRHLLNNIRVVICGKGSDEAALRAYTTAHELDSIVQFEGYVSEDDKAGYLASADVAVFPSTGGESFGIVLIEAMAAGAQAVLGGDNPGYRSVLADGPNLLIDPHRTAEFAQRLHHLITSEKERRLAHNWQKKAVNRYDVQTVGPQLVDYYQQAIAKRAKHKDNNK